MVDNPATGVRLEELVKTAEKCTISRDSLGVRDAFEELDTQGTHLWNLSTTLAREAGVDTKVILHGWPLVSHGSSAGSDMVVRLLAYYMLDCSQPSGRQNAVRLFKVAVKVGRACLGTFCVYPAYWG